MFRNALFLVTFALMQQNVISQVRTDKLLAELFHDNTHPIFREVIGDPATYRLQVTYTQINRDGKNKPSFKNYYFNYDPGLYFNPASMVKLPLAILSLEKLGTLQNRGINKYTALAFEKSQPWQTELKMDSSAAGGVPSMAHLIKRALLISENDPYNRMYQFVGQQEINRTLHRKGYQDARITRQFLGLTPDENRHTNAVSFYDEKGNLLYRQLPAYNTDSFDFSRKILVGNAHISRGGKLVNEPFDFTMHNNLSLLTMQRILQSVLFPSSVKAKQRFDLDAEDRAFLLQYLSQYPSETPDPKYDETLFYDSYVKFFFRDSTRKMPEGIRVFNKVGWSYGFMTDVSYVADFKNNIEFMLSATLYVNPDGILNDNKYEYDSVGYPFLYQLGQTIYRYELTRKRKHIPDLSEFNIQYERRDPNDQRKPLREVDN